MSKNPKSESDSPVSQDEFDEVEILSGGSNSKFSPVRPGSEAEAIDDEVVSPPTSLRTDSSVSNYPNYSDDLKTPSPDSWDNGFDFSEVLSAIEKRDVEKFRELILNKDCDLGMEIDCGKDHPISLYDFICDVAGGDRNLFANFFNPMFRVFVNDVEKYLSFDKLDKNFQDIVLHLLRNDDFGRFNNLCEKIEDIYRNNQESSKENFFNFLNEILEEDSQLFFNPLLIAIGQNENNLLKFLVENLDSSKIKRISNKNGMVDLPIFAIERGEFESFKVLVENNCIDFEKSYEDGGNLLKFVFFRNRPEVYGILFDRCPEDLRLRYTGLEVINIVSGSSNYDMFGVAKKFFEKDPERLFDTEDRDRGAIPVQRALRSSLVARSQGIDFCTYLIDKTCEALNLMDFQDRAQKIRSINESHGRLFLLDFVDDRDLFTFQKLVDAGFDPFEVGNDGKSAFDYVCREYENLVTQDFAVDDLEVMTGMMVKMSQDHRSQSKHRGIELNLAGQRFTVLDLVRAKLYSEMENPELGSYFPEFVRGEGNIVMKLVNGQRVGGHFKYPAEDLASPKADQFTVNQIERRHSASF